MPPSVVVLGTHIENIEMIFSKFINKIIAKIVIAKFGLEHWFHEVGLYFYIPWIHYKFEDTFSKIWRKY